MRIVTLSGWGTKQDALKHAIPPGFVATPISYAACNGFDELRSVLDEHRYTDIAMGWSLGAQLIARAVAENVLQPKMVVLIAPPYQYVNGGDVRCGMSSLMFKTFRATYHTMPKMALKQLAVLTAKASKRARAILDIMDDNPEHFEAWGNWLEYLGRFSCNHLDFSEFPATLIVRGAMDHVTPPKQSQLFADKIARSKLVTFNEAGHAPQMVDQPLFHKLVRETWEQL